MTEVEVIEAVAKAIHGAEWDKQGFDTASADDCWETDLTVEKDIYRGMAVAAIAAQQLTEGRTYTEEEYFGSLQDEYKAGWDAGYTTGFREGLVVGGDVGAKAARHGG